MAFIEKVWNCHQMSFCDTQLTVNLSITWLYPL